jgi:hypothetical protein
MRVMIIGSLAGELGKAARIAIAHGAKLDQADDADTALARLRSDGRFDLVLCELTHNVGAVVRALAAERMTMRRLRHRRSAMARENSCRCRPILN